MMSAVISHCNQYRYILGREVDVYGVNPATTFVMLNPSTADASEDDPTIRRCKDFAIRNGSRMLSVVNLYAMRATSPEDLWRTNDPAGPLNNRWLQVALERPGIVICGWGNKAKPDGVQGFLKLAKAAKTKLWALNINKDGTPRHPLYIKADSPLLPYPPHPYSR